MKMKHSKKILMFLTILSFQFGKAQSISDYEKMLTDDSFQEWILRENRPHLGDEECTEGLKLKFLKENKEVIRKECIEKKWELNSYNWTIKEVGSQWVLGFGPYTFEIDFLSNSNIENPDGSNVEMRLRSTISPDKGKEVNDLFFNKN